MVQAARAMGGSAARSSTKGGVLAAVLGVAVLGSVGCDRKPAPADKPGAPSTTVSPSAGSAVAEKAGAAAGAGGQAAPANAPEVPASDGVYLCTNKYEDQVVQRVLLPTGEAYVISHGPQTWATSDGQHLEPGDLALLERAFREHRFLEFPEHEHANTAAGREWDLRFASPDHRHHSTSYEEPSAAFREVFSACERAFASLTPERSDVTTALAIYRALEEYAQSLQRPDPRRQMLLDWLDSLQADFSGP